MLQSLFWPKLRLRLPPRLLRRRRQLTILLLAPAALAVQAREAVVPSQAAVIPPPRRHHTRRIRAQGGAGVGVTADAVDLVGRDEGDAGEDVQDHIRHLRIPRRVGADPLPRRFRRGARREAVRGVVLRRDLCLGRAPQVGVEAHQGPRTVAEAEMPRERPLGLAPQVGVGVDHGAQVMAAAEVKKESYLARAPIRRGSNQGRSLFRENRRGELVRVLTAGVGAGARAEVGADRLKDESGKEGVVVAVPTHPRGPDRLASGDGI